MSRIRSSNTSPELALRRALHELGFRFRLHRKDLPGKPDIVLPRYRTVVFVHGCFWHRHAGCKVATTPKSNRSEERRLGKEGYSKLRTQWTPEPQTKK